MERLTFAVDNGKLEGRTLSGVAHVYGMVTRDGRNMRFAPGAFTKSIARGQVVSFAHHDDSKLLASQSAGTLRLADSPTDMGHQLDLPEGVSYAEDLKALAARGEPLGMSFSVNPATSRSIRETVGGQKVTTWVEADLISVDPVALAAFDGTSVILNSRQDERKPITHRLMVRARVRAKDGGRA
jgi:Escherichia/Staphylococcus phage prohead protease